MGQQIWPGWDTIEKIGAGGFSTVYKIKSLSQSNKYSALKVMSIPKSQDEYHAYQADGYSDEVIEQIFREQVDNLVKEFRIMSGFTDTTNIVHCEDYMVVPKNEGFGWDILIRMELLTTLADHHKRVPLTEKEIAKLGIDLCNALTQCKKNNVVHRDIKPQNIFVDAYGNYKLGDFGIARVTEQATHATRIGTYSYMSPEIYRGDGFNCTADIYSLGLVLYSLLNEKRLPFLPLPPNRLTQDQITNGPIRRFSGEPIPPPKHGIDWLKAIVLKATAFNPADRYQSAEAMEADLRTIYNALPTAPLMGGVSGEVSGRSDIPPVPPVPQPQPTPEKEESSLRLIGIVALVSIIVLTALIFVIFYTMKDNGSASPSEEHTGVTYVSELHSLHVETLPYKTHYELGEPFDPTGLVLKAVYSDGTSKLVEHGYTTSYLDTNKAGRQSVNIQYDGGEATIYVTVYDSSVSEYSEAPSYTPSFDSNSSEAVSSTDISFVDAPYTPPEDINYITTAAKTNYALGKTYTLTRDSTDTDPSYLYHGYNSGDTRWSDEYLRKMTDGVVGDITNKSYSSIDGALEGVTVQLAGTNKLFEYVFDLENYYGDVRKFVFRNVRHGIPNGNNRGFKLRLAYISDDGVNWTKLNGSITSELVPGAPGFMGAEVGVVNPEHFNFTYTLDEAAKGRFLRLCLVSDGGYVIQLEEIEVWN